MKTQEKNKIYRGIQISDDTTGFRRQLVDRLRNGLLFFRGKVRTNHARVAIHDGIALYGRVSTDSRQSVFDFGLKRVKTQGNMGENYHFSWEFLKFFDVFF